MNGLPHDLTMNMVINPNNSNILYITLWAQPGSATWQGGVYQSTDGGINWTAKNNGLPKDLDAMESGLTSNYVDILADKNNPNVLYVSNPSWVNGGIFKTTDVGSTWV